VTTFGETLRAFRQASNDPDRLNRRLTQQRLGRLIGEELGDFGFSGAAVSDWERGESKINAEDRSVLIALIKILHRCGGLQTLEDANHLLKAGKYGELDVNEVQKIFKKAASKADPEQPISETKSSKFPLSAFLASLFSKSEAEVETLIARAQKGPAPAWPRMLAVFMRLASERFSISLTTVMWIWLWLFALWLIAPSLRLPFANRAVAVRAMGMYVAGTLIIPLLVGLLINTKNNEFWEKQRSVNHKLLRLYTYQGAGIGFNLGYFFVFPFVLARYYLGLGSSLWLEVAAAALGLILGNMAARVVPHNLWLAYDGLRFKDGAIFFVVAFLGPLWGLFFLEYYSILLTPIPGIIAILLALTGIIILGMYQFRKKT
jgi:hypothetical protein